MDVFNELIKREPNLLSRPLEELVPISFIGQAAVAAYRVMVKRLPDLPMSEEQKKRTLKDGQDAGINLLAIEGRIGELLPSLEEMKTKEVRVKAQKGERSLPQETTRLQAHKARIIANNPGVVNEVIAEAEENEDIPTKTAVLNKVNKKREKERKADAEKRGRKIQESLSVTAQDLQMRMMQVLTLVPPKVPKGLSDHDYSVLCALAETIITRLEKYCGKEN